MPCHAGKGKGSESANLCFASICVCTRAKQNLERVAASKDMISDRSLVKQVQCLAAEKIDPWLIIVRV